MYKIRNPNTKVDSKMTDTGHVLANIVAGMWVDGWVDPRTLEKDQVARAYAPHLDTDKAIKVIETGIGRGDVPLIERSRHLKDWPPSVAVVDNPETVRDFIDDIDESLVPFDLR